MPFVARKSNGNGTVFTLVTNAGAVRGPGVAAEIRKISEAIGVSRADIVEVNSLVPSVLQVRERETTGGVTHTIWPDREGEHALYQLSQLFRGRGRTPRTREVQPTP